MTDNQSLAHTKWECKYHVVWIPKYRKKKLFEGLRKELGPVLRELARLLQEPKALHAVRLSNKSSYPLSTAPALVMRDGRILAQGLMTYTAIGADGDLPITQAVEIGVKKQDKELKRVPNAETWQGREYGRVDLAGEITITNRRDQAVELVVVLGQAVVDVDEGAGHVAVRRVRVVGRELLGLLAGRGVDRHRGLLEREERPVDAPLAKGLDEVLLGLPDRAALRRAARDLDAAPARAGHAGAAPPAIRQRLEGAPPSGVAGVAGARVVVVAGDALQVTALALPADAGAAAGSAQGACAKAG